MAADTFDPILGLILQGTGNNNNAWGTICDNSMITPAARAIAGQVTRTNTGGTLDLSGSPPPTSLRQDLDAIQIFNGLLTSDQTVIVPNLSKSWFIVNNTTGAFNLYWKTTAGTATQIPQGTMKLVICDGSNNMIRTDKERVGEFRISGKASAGAGELACNGASLLRASFPDLFAAIGATWGSVDGVHFTLPLLTDTNRFLRAGGGGGPAVGTYQSNQNLAHTHTVTGAPTVSSLTTDSQGSHAHAITDPGHSHTTNAQLLQNGAGGPQANGTVGGAGYNNPSTNPATTSISINAAGAHTHTVTGTLTAGTLANASSGGSEARPESAAVLICIVY